MNKNKLWLMSVVLAACGAQGAVRYVSSTSGSDAGDGTSTSAPCKTIQHAVDVSGSGDEIRIATFDVATVGFPPAFQTNTCVYTNTGAAVISLPSGKSLALKGGYVYIRTGSLWQQSVIPPVVDGQHARRCLVSTGGDNDTNHVELLEFARGAASDGANVYAAGGSVQLVGTPIHDGTASNAGGGVYMSGVKFSVSLGSYTNLALPQITGLLPIYNNSAALGGGLFLDGGYPALTTVGVLSNNASGNGGGVFIRGGMPSVVGGTIQANTSGGNGGGIYLSNSVARVGGMIVCSNRAVFGGAIYYDGPFALTLETATLIANNYIQNNAASGGRGGAYYFNMANVGVINNVITGNSATNGAAAYLYASSPRFYQNTIADNPGDTALYVTHDPGTGWAQIIPPVVFGGFVISPGQTNFFSGIPVPSWPTFTNTIISGQATALWVNSSSNSTLQNKVVMAYTLWSGNTTDIAGAGTVTHTQDLYGDPLYVSKGTPPNDMTSYHIRTNSPAVNAGTTVSLTLPGTDLLLDIDAQLRPSGQGMDIGADEVVTDPFSVCFVPAVMANTAQPGTVVTNQHYLLNSGTQNDTYRLSVSNSLWSGSVSPTVITLNSQSYTNVTVTVTVPAGAANATTNITLVLAMSQTDTNRTALAVDTTSVSTNTGGANLRYVWQSSPTPTAPYTSLDTAGHNIQTVVDACAAGDTVLVYPGTYNTGGAVTPGYSLTNRVCITNAITLTSLSGPDNTHIVGAADPATTNGPAAVRCLYMSTNASVSGFDFSDGHTLASDVDWHNVAGGGVCLGGSGMISNCTIVSCTCYAWGGGLYAVSTGAVWDTRVRSCVANGLTAYGGGAYLANSATMNNCLVYGNAATAWGGGVFVVAGGGVYNCTLSGNAAGTEAGGLYANASASLNNDIIYFNNAPTNANLSKGSATIKNCCTTPNPGGAGIVTADPLFVGGGDYHLQSSSPCIDKGTADRAPNHDLDGNSRPLDGDGVAGAAMDIGCYEVYNSNGDSDGDGVTDGNELLAGTNPLDATSYFHIISITNRPPLTVTFTTVTNRVYSLCYATNLIGAPWLVIPGQSNVAGTVAVMALQDTNTAAVRFYRVKVALP